MVNGEGEIDTSIITLLLKKDNCLFKPTTLDKENERIMPTVDNRAKKEG